MRPLVCRALLAACVPWVLLAQVPERAPAVLPESAAATLVASLDAARAHARHVWRDTPPFAADALVNAFIEIPRGERRKWEFDMRANRRVVDRVMPADVGGYPVNYGFVPQTVSYDGDPFDALVLGPPLRGGRVVRGAIVGLMLMEDEKGIDSKVVLSPLDRQGQARYALTDEERTRIAEYFRIYKRHEPGAFSRVPGWGSAADGRAYIETTHAFFQRCRLPKPSTCSVDH